MKMVRVAYTYPSYVHTFYRQNPGLDGRPYEEQRAALCRDGFSQHGAWAPALRPLGYDFEDVFPNVAPLQAAWAREHPSVGRGVDQGWASALDQLRHYAPDILFANAVPPAGWLRSARETCPSIRLVLMFCGHPFSDASPWDDADVVLTCLERFAEVFRQRGKRAEVLHYAFNHHVLSEIPTDGPRPIGVSFVGGLVRRPGYHLERIRLLERLAGKAALEIRSPEAEITWLSDLVNTGVRAGLYAAFRALRAAGVANSRLRAMPLVGRASDWDAWPLRQWNSRLRPYMKPAVYGLAMHRVLGQSQVTLNVHGDIAGAEAANVRLFEATGMGACLLTDWKANLSRFFDPEREIVTYRSVDECIEKAQWLLAHPQQCREIALAGQQRTLREHTLANRATRIHEIVQGALAVSGQR